jgi:hypothetical protein
MIPPITVPAAIRAAGRSPKGALALLGVWAVLGGCQSGASNSRPAEPPPGSQAARVQVPDEALDQFVDLAAQDLGTRLPATPIVRDSAYRQVLGLGVIRGVGFPSPDAAESAVRRLQSRLNTNQALSNAFRMVDMSRGESAQLLGEIAGGSDTTRSPRSAASSAQQTYRPQDVLVLSGDFIQAGSPDQGTVVYTFVATVQHPSTRAQVLSSEVRRNFRWDASRTRWIAAD